MPAFNLSENTSVTRHVGRDYNTGVMRFFGSRSLARSAPLAAVAVLLCVWVFLPWLMNGPEAPGFLVGAHHSQVDQGANGDGHPPTGSFLSATGEEAKDADKRPVNADLLTVLLLASFFGAIVRSEEHTSELQSRQYLVCRLL